MNINTDTCTSLALGYFRRERVEDAEELFSRMRRVGPVPDAHTYTVMIDGYGNIGDIGRMEGKSLS